MKRFRFNKSEQAVIWSTVTWANSKKMTTDEAFQRALKLHTTNPEAIPNKTLKSLRRQVETILKEGDKRAQENSNDRTATRPLRSMAAR